MSQRISETQTKPKKHWLSLIIMIVLIGITFFFSFKGQSVYQLTEMIKHTKPLFLVIGGFLMLFFVLCEACNIFIILRKLGREAPFIRCIGYAFAGFYFSSITPSASGGQPAQIYYMKRDHIQIAHSSLTLLLITVAFQVVMLLYCMVMFIWQFSFVKETAVTMRWLLIFGIVINALLCGIVIVALISKRTVKKLVLGVFCLLEKTNLFKNTQAKKQAVLAQLEAYGEGAQYIKKNPWLSVQVFIITVIQKTAFYLVPYFVYLAMGLQGHTALQMVAVQALLTVAVSSLPLPGAVGASEAGFVTMFALFFSKEFIVPAMLLSRGISFYFMLLVSGIITGVLQYKKIDKKKIFTKEKRAC